LTLLRKRRILCICDPRPGGTSGYRLRSFQRLGQDVIPFDATRYRPSGRFLSALAVRAPIGPFVRQINRDLLRAVREHKPDVVFFDRPIRFTKRTILQIKDTGATTVYFNQDNPFGPRNDPGWYQLRKVFRLFDLYCAIRKTDAVRFQQWGLQWVRIMLSFEPSIHFPPTQGWSDDRRSRYVSYIGTFYEDRPEFLRALAGRQHLPLTVSGSPLWAKVWPADIFARCFRYGELIDDRYREEIWRSRINLSFITRLNEEDIGHKSVEIAACQGFLLALRTPGHQAIFKEDREAVFFSSVEECADKCRFYLNRPDLREAIARRGRERAARSGYDNDTQLARILNRLDGADVP
jgi:spore maturation protein CgeB